ncbi:MAG: competence/damage-inducible protein A [Phycisphaerales bacterium]|nr:competence/damage-inducible protein A [Phycisphaerales bacterium]
MSTERRAAVLSVGDELILGQIADTNARWILGALAEVGFLGIEHRTLPDDRAAIATAILEFARRVDAIVVTGGLGPTADDLTREALGDAAAPQAALELDPVAIDHLESFFTRRGRTMSPSNRKQALRPPGTAMLPNPNGTAMGIAARIGACAIFCLPGPPREMQPMFRASVVPALPTGAGAIATAAVHQLGLGESVAAERLGAMMDRDRSPTVGTTASGGVVTARIRAEGDRASASALVEETARQVERAWHPYAYGRDERTLVGAVASLLVESQRTLAVAESCTGGMLGSTIVDFPGASDFFVGGWIVYSNALKERLLGVPTAMLEAHGAVSEPVARALAQGAVERSGSDYGLAITGIAGPGGGSEGKPVGTVYVGLAQRDGGKSAARRFVITGDRHDVRERSARLALQMLRLELLGMAEVPLLWEAPPAGEKASTPATGRRA